MDIGPYRYDRWNCPQPDRVALLLNQVAAQQCEQPCEQVGPRQTVDGGCKYCENDERHRWQQCCSPPQSQTEQQGEGQSNDDSACGQHSVQAPPSMNLGHAYIEQPLPGKPRASGHVRKQIRMRDGVILQNPLAGADVPADARVVQEPEARRSIRQGQDEADEQDVDQRRQEVGGKTAWTHRGGQVHAPGILPEWG